MAVPLSVNIVIVSALLNVAALTAVFFRFRARYLQKSRLGIDDYTIVPAALLAVGIGISNSIGVAAVQRNIGMEGLSGMDSLLLFLKTDNASILMSILSLALTKYSVVSFYRRVFRSCIFLTLFQVTTAVLLAATAAWGVAFFLAVLLQCVPVAGAWDPVVRKHAQCYSPVPTFYAIAISDTVMDVIILAVPQPLVWKMNIPRRQKIAVSGVFLLGAFVLGVSTARIPLFFAAGKASGGSADPNAAAYSLPPDVATPLYWTHIECSVAVISACLPTMRILFQDFSFTNFPGLSSFASKLSLRNSSKGSRSGSQPNLQRRKASSAKADSISSVPETQNHPGQVVPLSKIEVTENYIFQGPTPTSNYSNQGYDMHTGQYESVGEKSMV